MRICLLILAVVIGAAAGCEAAAWPVQSGRLRGVAQDSAGQAWAIGESPSVGIYKWSDGWRLAAVDGVPDQAEPLAIFSGADGNVYAVWGAGSSIRFVTRHHGNNSTVLAQLPGPLGRFPNIFVDSHGAVWITAGGPQIYRILPGEKPECVYTIPDDAYSAQMPARSSTQAYDPLLAAGDSKGRIWFWSKSTAHLNLLSLHGILIYDGEKFTRHTPVADGSVQKVLALAPRDAGSMWMALDDNQLYRVDESSFGATAVSEPEIGAFRYVQSVVTLAGATYVVAATPDAPVQEPKGEGRFDILWRLRNGAWERVITGIDMRPMVSWDRLRTFLPTPRGFWISAYGTGPWFVPNDSTEPLHLDWHYNFPLGGSDALLALPDGRLLISDSNHGSVAASPVELFKDYQVPRGIRTLNPVRTFVQDGRGHLWGTLTSGDNAISEWDGKNWIRHPLPVDFIDSLRFSFALDSDNDFWMLPNRGPCIGPTAVLPATRDAFDSYPDLQSALQAQLPRNLVLQPERPNYDTPVFTADGRIGYHDRCGRLHYFDGSKWLQWTDRDITGDPRPVRRGAAFFDRSGKLAVNFQETTWQFTPGEGWHSTTFEAGWEAEDIFGGSRPDLTDPPGCAFGSPESIARDRLGTYWMTYQGQLYRAIPGLCLLQTNPPEHQPFVDGRTVRNALVDPEGNAYLETYLQTSPEAGEYVVVSAQGPAPKPEVTASVDSVGMVKLRFGAKGKLWYMWRVDQNEWTRPSQDAEANVAGLSAGKHRIEVTAIDARLQMNPVPAVAEVSIQAVTGNQIGKLIGDLSGPDYSVRNAAIEGLARQPGLALPLLQAARKNATPDQRWWIDAAIQRIGRASQGATKP
jgi:hypothetical protein